MSGLKSVKKFQGVFYRESKRRVHNGRPDKSFTICYNHHGKKRWQTIGWASLGITAETAHTTRLEVLRRLRTGQGPLAPHREELTAGQAIERYLDWAESEGRQIRSFRYRYKRWIAPRCAALPLSRLDHVTLGELKAEAQAAGLAPSTLRGIFALIQVSINQAIKQRLWPGVNPLSPAGGMSLPPPGGKCERFLKPDEARLLLKELQKTSPIWHDMALVSLHTGLRLTELFKMEGRDIDQANNLVTVTAKGGAREPVPLTPESLAALARHIKEPNELVFCRPDKQPFKNAYGPFTRSVKVCGLNNGLAGSRHKVWFHTLRHTFASWLAQSGVDIYAIMKLMRHKNIAMTQRYAHLIPEQQREHLAVIREKLGKH
jgi:integrase